MAFYSECQKALQAAFECRAFALWKQIEGMAALPPPADAARVAETGTITAQAHADALAPR